MFENFVAKTEQIYIYIKILDRKLNAIKNKLRSRFFESLKNVCVCHISSISQVQI